MSSIQFEEPMYFSAEVDLFIIITFSTLGILVNRKFLKDMKDDERASSPSLIQDVMVARTKAVMVVHPLSSLLYWSLTLDHHYPDWYYQIVCYEQYSTMFWRFYFGFTTFIISSIRYIFIVYNERVLSIGKEEVKRIFYILSIFLPLTMTILHACVLPEPPSSYNIAHKTCNKYLEASYNMTCQITNGIHDNCAPILPIVMEYIPTGVAKVVGVMVKVMYIVMCTNIMEGILYWRTFKKIQE